MNPLHTRLANTRHLDLVEMAKRIEAFVGEWWKSNPMPWFTDHGPGHSRRVAEYALQIGNIPNLPDAVKLSSLEIAILWASAWLHDLGMQSLLGRRLGPISTEQQQQIRHEHPNESALIILREAEAIGIPPDPPLRQAIAYVARAHGTDFFVSSCDFLRHLNVVRNEPVRGPLLGAILLLADELDLHYERALPSRAHPVLNHVSEAHALKHRLVLACGVEHRAGGDVALKVSMQPPRNFPETLSLEVETWITEKLRRQIVMVEDEFAGGFDSYARLSRAVSIRRVPSLVDETLPSSLTMAQIESDNARSRLLDHAESLRTANGTVADRTPLLLVGALDENYVDLSGREDVLAAVEKHAAAGGAHVLSSKSVFESAGAATLVDGLEEWLACAQDLGAVYPPARISLEQLEQLLTAAISSAKKQVVLSFSSVDRLAQAEFDLLTRGIIPRLLQLADISVVATSDGELPAWPGSVEHQTVGTNNLDIDDAASHLTRYTSRANAQDEADAMRKYHLLRKLRDQHLLRLAGGL